MQGSASKRKPEQLTLSVPLSPFDDRHRFADEVHGAIRVSDIERDIIDSPEYQRLFRISQLGFVELVFPSANHTRGIHSIGCCGVAKKLIDKVNENIDNSIFAGSVPRIARSERILISLAALLHDISHGPYAHDIEKKNHEIRIYQNSKIKMKSYYGPYEKHDDFESNPILYISLLKPERSCLARVLYHHSPQFWHILVEDAKHQPHLYHFVEAVQESRWVDVATDILPQLIYHLLIFEKPSEAAQSSKLVSNAFPNDDGASTTEHWGLGPEAHRSKLHFAWYQPYRHDIIGDTLSADLLDYLQRDARRLGIKRGFDAGLLNHYVLVPADLSHDAGFPPGKNKYYRCAIDLNDYKRGPIRVERLNDIFRLLDLRHEIHEKAVFHRIVQSAIAMMSRALSSHKPTLEQIYGYADSPSPALAGEDHFLDLVITSARDNPLKSLPPESQSLPHKIAERRVHHPLMVIPGDHVRDLHLEPKEDKLETTLRELAAVVDSRYFSHFFLFISWCIEQLLEHGFDSEEDIDRYIVSKICAEQAFLEWAYQKPAPRRVIFSVMPYKQLYKDPAVLVCVGEHAFTLDMYKEKSIPPSIKNRIEYAMKDANSKYAASWKLYVFISDGLFYTGTLAKLFQLPCAKDEQAHKQHLYMAQDLVVRAIRAAWQQWDVIKSDWKNLEGTIDRQRLPLENEMSLQEFAKLLQRFASDGTSFRASYPQMREAVSAVDTEHYVHTDGSRKCRDIRYKYDGPATKVPSQGSQDGRTGTTIPPAILAILKAANRQAEDFRKQELLELSHRLSAAGNHSHAVINMDAARGEPDLNKEFVQRLWREEPDLI